MDEETIQIDSDRSLARVGLSRRYGLKKKGNYLISSPAQPTFEQRHLIPNRDIAKTKKNPTLAARYPLKTKA